MLWLLSLQYVLPKICYSNWLLLCLDDIKNISLFLYNILLLILQASCNNWKVRAITTVACMESPFQSTQKWWYFSYGIWPASANWNKFTSMNLCFHKVAMLSIQPVLISMVCVWMKIRALHSIVHNCTLFVMCQNWYR